MKPFLIYGVEFKFLIEKNKCFLKCDDEVIVFLKSKNIFNDFSNLINDCYVKISPLLMIANGNIDDKTLEYIVSEISRFVHSHNTIHIYRQLYDLMKNYNRVIKIIELIIYGVRFRFESSRGIIKWGCQKSLVINLQKHSLDEYTKFKKIIDNIIDFEKKLNEGNYLIDPFENILKGVIFEIERNDYLTDIISTYSKQGEQNAELDN